jgi:RNA polymerase sigma factor (sigma-70 family)
MFNPQALTDSEREIAAAHVGYALKLTRKRYRRLDPATRDLVDSTAFYAVCKAARGFDPGRGSFTTRAFGWIVGDVARMFRQEKRRGSPPCAGEAIDLDAPRVDGSTLADLLTAPADDDAEYQPSALESLVDRLPTRQRQIVHACYYDGLTDIQAAAALGTTRANVFHSRRAALGNLRRWLLVGMLTPDE